ncbi:hypothetical protein K491DRAFT_590657 [Lophiostoma macrostomum CBS 122681]|uniref:Uncharacterized protein n=1 Tax=Lophiostoma macrostomum CBS 122681 TaxID=1314788 RepID=A0A6A6TJL9_9PLEO|nr:hypothetical protein K491DRAFT_590657 [Lophiostoma macrostomum CBS 122681]
MRWLQVQEGQSNLQALQLDIVGFLAILGEGSVLANAQVSTLSKWIFLPRLLPAPQALMRPTRPEKLEPVPGWVTGIFSGMSTDNINHIGNIICDANNLPAHSVRVVSIRRKGVAALKSKTFAPLTLVLFLGFFFSAVLFALSIWRSDGMSTLATILLSLLSSLIGWGNKWTLRLPVRVSDAQVPQGDVVIRYPKGSFLVVHCDEFVARELYFAPETIEYMLEHGPAYRILSLVGTMMLMGGVICLANAQIELQIAWAASYMLLGSSYWIVAALPQKVHWDTSPYIVENECLSDSDMDVKGYPSRNAEKPTFTQALWKAIVLSKSKDWVRQSNACPDTDAWNEWLGQALEQAQSKGEAPRRREGKRLQKKLPKHLQREDGVVTWEVPDWNPQKVLGDLLKKEKPIDNRKLSEKAEVMV